jgi:hypothetical protein
MRVSASRRVFQSGDADSINTASIVTGSTAKRKTLRVMMKHPMRESAFSMMFQGNNAKCDKYVSLTICLMGCLFPSVANYNPKKSPNNPFLPIAQTTIPPKRDCR